MAADDKTTVQISLALDERIKKLAKQRSDKMGISTPLAKGTYLEVLITEEEERVKSDGNS